MKCSSYLILTAFFTHLDHINNIEQLDYIAMPQMYSKNKNGRDKACIALPIISSKAISFYNVTWNVYFYDEYASILFENSGGWKSGFAELLRQNVLINRENDFRESITFECIPLLAAFFFKKKEILYVKL